ncbi:uncharacterized protein LY79DRAFT_536350 [Colletotrichum navitas]|uniref:Uncharacterized protein n=1 Tax=Colletotrichum navitas TaxID=681940 RepID=A0AAD8VBE6_9PEZI|nr:uncharacterized protein LY79DRAFT_536350 [Colletotrichum navitas]KAK1598896.1 hypothetical protein LY79DRAFT_536350 [Colletotrichum navitas]
MYSGFRMWCHGEKTRQTRAGCAASTAGSARTAVVGAPARASSLFTTRNPQQVLPVLLKHANNSRLSPVIVVFLCVSAFERNGGLPDSGTSLPSTGRIDWLAPR